MSNEEKYGKLVSPAILIFAIIVVYLLLANADATIWVINHLNFWEP